MKSIIIFLIALFSFTSSFAQKKIPESRYSKSRNPYGQSYKNVTRSLKVFAGGSLFNFQNSTYNLNRKSGILTSFIGYAFGIEFAFNSFILSSQLMKNDFEIKYLNTELYPSLYGTDIDLMWNLLPSFNYLNFLVGAGYSYYGLRLHNSDEQEYLLEGMSVSQPFLKVGVSVPLNRNGNIRLEYQQSLNMNESTSYNRVSLIFAGGLAF